MCGRHKAAISRPTRNDGAVVPPVLTAERNRDSAPETTFTGKVLRVTDPQSKKPLVDMVLDKAGQKGTGKWTSEVALDLGIIVPTINASVDARTLSGRKDERVEASKQIKGPDARYTGDKKAIYTMARKSYLAVKLGKPSELYDMVHTENFVLVDTKRRVRGFYDGTKKEEIQRLIADINWLSQQDN